MAEWHTRSAQTRLVERLCGFDSHLQYQFRMERQSWRAKVPANAKKDALLGMPLGTASARLRKELLFHLAKKLGLTTCCRCGEEIDGVKKFSIDHLDAWQRAENPVEAFFDLENVAFSHLGCNVRAAEHPEWTGVDKEKERETNRIRSKRYYWNNRDSINEVKRAKRKNAKAVMGGTSGL